MGASMQTMALPAGHEVTINWGLGKGRGRTVLPVASRIRHIARVLREVARPEFKHQLVLTPQRVWLGEPLCVVHATLQADANMHMLLWDAVVATEQDCIAIYDHVTGIGHLFGPRASEWGAFNINFFTFLGDKNE
jgi:hypothetical protein